MAHITASTNTAYDRVIDRLDGVRRSGSSTMARCPAHDDRSPSLSITPAEGGVLLYCHAGCEPADVVTAMGLTTRDLYDQPRTNDQAAGDRWLPGGLTWVEAYDYSTESGTLVYQVIRGTDPAGQKTFRQRRPDPSARSGWTWSLSALDADDRHLPYRLPEVLAAIGRGEEVWIAEGEKDCGALRAAGVTATCNSGGAGKWHPAHARHLRGAQVVITRDRDAPGIRHQSGIAASLSGVAASVRLVEPAEGNDAADHLAAGLSLAKFVDVDPAAEAPAGSEIDSVASTSLSPPHRATWYEAGDGGMYLVSMREGRDGEPSEARTRLTSFTARIIASTEVDDGSEVERRLDLEAVVAGRTRTCSIPATEFTRMDWVVPELGPAAVIEAGRGTKDHARAAIQSLSEAAEVKVFGQTGWRQVDGEWAYLHAGGAIGPTGAVAGVEVDLPGSLAGYELPEPGGVEATRASLRVLDVAPDRIMIPLLAAVYRAPLGGVDMACGVHGMTGIGKSELAALAQQHYGSTLDARGLPASWSSTANSLEEQAFLTADAMLVVDDFCPAGSQRDVDRLQATADRLIRGAGNGAGRGRMARDGSLRASRPSRGLILTTGEEVPRGASLRARMMTVEVRRGDVDWDVLGGAQQDAASGSYAAAMAAYVVWLAPRLDTSRAARSAQIAALRAQVTTAHRRTATAIASLAWGWQTWLRFAVETGAVTPTDRDALWERGWVALLAAAEAADAAVGETDPAQRFLTLVGSALASGRAHVATRQGGCPASNPGAWGWRSRDGVMQDIGQRVGWTEGEDLWLDPEAAYAAARAAGEGLTIDAETLRARLSDAGILQTKDASGRTGVRVRLEGRQRRVLHLRADVLEDRDEVRHPGVSEVSRGDSARDTLRHQRDTGVSHSLTASDQEEDPQIDGETPETHGNHLLMDDPAHWDPDPGRFGPDRAMDRSYAPARAVSAGTGVTAAGGAA